MTKLEQTPMSSARSMQWAPQATDLTFGALNYSPYSPPNCSAPGLHLPAPPVTPAATPGPAPGSGTGTLGSGTGAGPGTGALPLKMSTLLDNNTEAKAAKRKSLTPTVKKPASQSSSSDAAANGDSSQPKSSKPTHSYSFLISTAITESPQRQMTLNEIYEWVMDHYPWYRTAVNGWKNSIRHNLSLNKAFMRVPRPPSEPGKGSYWKLDPTQPSPLDLPQNGGPGVIGLPGGTSRTGRTSRRSSAAQRGPSSKSATRRAASDPTPHLLPFAQGADIALTPVPVLPKRPGQDNDPYVFKIDNPPAPTIIPGLPTSATTGPNRRHSHLLSHDQSYGSSQDPFQPLDQPPTSPHGAYPTPLTSSFGLSGFNPQHQQSALFTPASPTGTSSSADYGSPTSIYSAPSQGLSSSTIMESSTDSSFSRFSNPGLYFPPGGTSPVSSMVNPTRAMSISGSSYGGGGNNGGGNGGNSGHYNDYTHSGYHSSNPGSNPGNNGSLSYPYSNGSSGNSMNQNGGAGASFYSSSVNYSFPTATRTATSGAGMGTGGGGPNTTAGTAAPSTYGSAQSYRPLHGYGSGPTDYSNSSAAANHPRPPSLMGLATPVGSFVSTSSPPTTSPYSLTQSFGPSTPSMLSPISPGSQFSFPTSPSPTNSMRHPQGSVIMLQDNKGAAASGLPSIATSVGNGINNSRNPGW